MEMDSIIAEIRKGREDYAKQFNYDLKAMVQDIRNRQAASGHMVVSFPPKPVRNIATKPTPGPLEHSVVDGCTPER
jgi:hypothetical protein